MKIQENCNVEENTEKKDPFKQGIKCENKFKALLNKTVCFNIKIPDCKRTGSSSRSPSDFLAVYQGFSHLFEVKWTKEIDKFDLKALTDYQFINLQKHSFLGGGKSFLVIFNPKGMYIINFNVVLRYKTLLGSNKIPFKDIRNNNLKLHNIFQ